MSESNSMGLRRLILVAFALVLPSVGAALPVQSVECEGCKGTASPAAHAFDPKSQALLVAFGHVEDGVCEEPLDPYSVFCDVFPCLAWAELQWNGVTQGEVTVTIVTPGGGTHTNRFDPSKVSRVGYGPFFTFCGDTWEFSAAAQGLSVTVSTACSECQGY